MHSILNLQGKSERIENMTRSELIQQVSELHPELTTKQVEECVSVILNEITIALSKRRRVELRGFGVFETRHRKERSGRNPRTGETVYIPSKIVPFFKAGKQLREKLNKK
jgi:integration host factor subunit beta